MNSEPEIIQLSTDENSLGERLDVTIRRLLGSIYSRTEIQQWIKDGLVTVNDSPSKAAYRLEDEDTVRIEIPAAEKLQVLPEPDVPFDVVYEDDDLIVVNKPAGVVVHPAVGNKNGTLVNGLLARYPEIATVGPEIARAGIVHRLDKDVSGVLLVARTQLAFDNLIAQFHDRTVQKHYIALVEQHPDNYKGVIEAPIGRDPRNRKRMAAHRDGRPAETEFYVRDFYGDRALLDVFPKTGRTHQIRVHLAFINCPIVGDKVYGYRKQRIGLKRIFLHAHQVEIEHPRTGEALTFDVEIPTALQDILNKLAQSH
jgi:23S rRNA pseudouridine1911/1915/1917 synthase